MEHMADAPRSNLDGTLERCATKAVNDRHIHTTLNQVSHDLKVLVDARQVERRQIVSCFFARLPKENNALRQAIRKTFAEMPLLQPIFLAKISQVIGVPALANNVQLAHPTR